MNMIEENFATFETLIEISVIAKVRGVNDISLRGIVGDVKAGGWTPKQDGLDYSKLLGGVNSTVNNPNVHGRDISMEDVEVVAGVDDVDEDKEEEEEEYEDEEACEDDEDEDEEENQNEEEDDDDDDDDDEKKYQLLFEEAELRSVDDYFVRYKSKFGALADEQREAVLNTTFDNNTEGAYQNLRNTLGQMAQLIDLNDEGVLNTSDSEPVCLFTDNLPEPEFSIAQILHVIFRSSKLYRKLKDGDETEAFLIELHSWIEGIPTGIIPSVFPFPTKEHCSYLQGTLLRLFFKNFKSGTRQLKETLEKIPVHSRDSLLFFCYIAGMVDGDGSIFGTVNGVKLQKPGMCIAVKRKKSESPIKELMKYMLPGMVFVSDRFIHIKLNGLLWTTTLFFLAFDMCMTIKYLQFCQVCLFAGSLPFFWGCGRGRRTHHSVGIAWQFLGPLLSGANYQHGNDFEQKFYDERLLQMIKRSPIYFLATMAGWIGSDGYVGKNIRLFQSNHNLIS